MGWLDFLKPKQIKESTAPRKDAGRREALGKLKESLDSWQMFDFLRDRYYGNGQWYFPVGGLPAVGGTTNKIQGRNQYVFYTEQDLRFQRDAARILYASEPVAKAIEGNLNAFVIGKGMKYKLCLKKGFETKATEEQLQEYQQLLDAWMDTEQWPEREQECFTAKVVDGEYFLRVVRTKGRVRTIRIEPEHIQNPEGVSFEDGWWLGVKYDPKDYETPIAYGYKLYGQEWEEIPAEEIIHFKSNVSRNVSRGVSDFYPILDDLDSVAKLSDNMRAGATAQAEIAYMMSVENATPNSINTFADEQAEVTLTNPVTGMEDKSRRSKPGTVKYHGDNVKFTTMPQGASQGYIEVYQNSMRIVASAFCMPEYMLTSDASNANYSSTLVAGTPFYRYVEKLQNLLKRPFKQVLMRVLDSLYADAQIPTELRAYLDIDVTCDSPVVVDPYQDAQRRDIELRNGVISPQMWAMEQGRDPQKVQQQIDEWRDANMGAVQQGGMGGQQQGNDGGMSIPKPGADGLGMDGVLAKESAIRESSWEEQKHPRASDGRFGHVSGAHGGKANVVSKADLDTHIKASKGRELYRGVPKKEHAKQFETGELRHGKGAYGHGIYVGYGYNGRDTASNAAGDEGHLARMSLSSDAKTITWNDAEEMWNKEGKEQYSIEKHGSSENAIAQMMRERGYDAIDVEHNEFMNVLNPEALVVEKPGGEGEKGEKKGSKKKKLKKTSDAEVSMSGSKGKGHEAALAARLKDWLPDWDDSETTVGETIASITGMPDDATKYETNVDFTNNGTDLETDGKFLRVSVTRKGLTMERLIGKDDKGVFIVNKHFEMKTKGKGTGAELFSKQVEAAASIGVYEIRCHAACTDDNGERYFNGYYTWPRLGYDQPLEGKGVHESDKETYDAAKERFPGAKTVLDVMQTEEGRQWWKDNGTDMLAARFDLSEGSRSLKIHQAYMEAKKSRK